MVFPVIGGDGKPTGYDIDNSLRFNPGDNAYLNRTPSSEGNKRTYTLSFWAKISVNYGTDTSTNNFFTARNSGGYTSGIQQISGGHIQAFIYDNTGGEGYKLQLKTNAVFRDVSAWYHIVLAVDTTQGTASNRAKLYVNGSQVTSFSTETYPDQNFDSHINDDVPHYMGNKDGSNDDYDGYLADFYLIDGTQYAASNFGETDDNGVWIPKDAKGDLTFGTNGFFMEFQQTGTSANASGKGADTSGQGNHYDDNNMTAEDITTDTPTNNFITWNALNHNGATLQEGATFTETRNSSDYDAGAMGNIGLTRGKWYWELKITAVGSHTYAGIINIGNRFDMADEDYDTTSGGTDGYPIYDYMELGKRGSNTGSGRSETGVVQATYGDGDILNFALDLDNNKIHYGKNGTYGESSDPANNTNGIAISDGVYYTPVVVGYGSGDIHANFGQPAFSISSGNSDAEGYGNFEYAVPSGYYSICTKNLAEYG